MSWEQDLQRAIKSGNKTPQPMTKEQAERAANELFKRQQQGPRHNGVRQENIIVDNK